MADDKGFTPLMVFKNSGQLEWVELLLKKGADVNVKSTVGERL